jgi:phosphoserine phosphatase
MTQGERSLPLLTASALVQRLAATASNDDCVLAFDGDGTLWSGDVSDDVFFAAASTEWFLEDARTALEQTLRACGLNVDGTLGTLALRLHDAHTHQKVPERLLFEAMTYCYAGRSAAALTEFATQVLGEKHITERMRFDIQPLLDWARSNGHHCYLVTASPAPIVAVPAKALGFDEHHIIASCATDDTGRIRNHIVSPIPYLEQKVVQLKQRANAHRLLAAFGDSPFDINLLGAAEIAVAVEPKPALVTALLALPANTVVRWLINQ